jgi:hypothetical protein
MKTLKQTGIETYNSPTHTHNVITRKHNTLRVSAAVAEYLLTLARFSDSDGLDIPFFTELDPEPAKVDLDFTALNVQRVVEQNPRDTDSIEAAARNPIYTDDEPAQGKVTPEDVTKIERTGSVEEAGGTDDDQRPPTREELDAKLAELPEVMTNEEIAVFIEDAVDYFGNLFTGADTEAVKARAKKPDADTDADTKTDTTVTKTTPAVKRTGPAVRKSQRS